MTVVVTHSTPSDSSFSASGAVAWDASHTLAGVGTMAGQDANTVAITGGAIDGTTVGNGTPAAGTFTTLIGGKDAANYGQLTGGATTKAVQFQTLGTDTNISMALQPKGTGAIDLAAGSSGVNISNGGTVTAITITANGANYTTPPTVAITAPTTAGGVQATATCVLLTLAVVTVNAGGTGYTVNDVLTLSAGTFTVAATYTVTAVSGGVVTAVSASSRGAYTVTPTTPAATTGGTGTGATLTPLWGVSPTLTITNAGSGYVEQPTITFSGGGGSAAAAYATVGGTAKITGIGAQTDFYTPSGAILSTLDGGLAATGAYLQLTNSSATNSINRVIGSGTNLGLYWLTKGTSSHAFATNNSSATVQFQVSHTASAVNYVQVTGSATGVTNFTTISSQGSDTNVNLALVSKGSGYIAFGINAATTQAFRVLGVGSSTGNLLAVSGSAAGAAPSIQAISGTSGTDTDIDLALTPKGAGNVRFATYTAGIIAQAGYITIKDSGGTVRRLLVG